MQFSLIELLSTINFILTFKFKGFPSSLMTYMRSKNFVDFVNSMKFTCVLFNILKFQYTR